MAELDNYKGFLIEELAPAQNRGFYLCPLCGSGTHSKKSAALSLTDNNTRWKCFSCGEGGDIFDLFAKRDGLSNAEAIKAVKAKYGTATPAPVRPAAPAKAAHTFDVEAYTAECSSRISGSDGEKYFLSRGLTPDTIRRFRLGYDPDCYVAPLHRRAPAVIIPYGGGCKYYAIRAIGEKAFGKPPRDAVGAEPVFNASALYGDSAPVFVVESQICALSIEQAGGKAIALGGTGGINRFIQQIDSRRPSASTFILCFDHDDAGRTAATKLGEALSAKGYPFVEAAHLISDGMKDPNDVLMKLGADDFAALVRKDIAQASNGQAEDAGRTAEEYAATSAAGYISAFVGSISAAASTPGIPTGYTPLDEALDGGLYEGMYVLGAISSLGKTTFALQMMDQIARAGHDTMVFSLEMARYELMARSISRITYQITRQKDGDKRDAKTTRGIMDGSKWAAYSSAERQLMKEAIEDYQQNVAPRVWIHEGVGDIGIEQIKEAVTRHITITGNRPVVLIDYLQILAPADVRMTDKQNTDKAVLELKRMSRDLKIPVVIVSSLNRANYTEPINTTAFKESGAIEYTADVILGLQYTGMDYIDGETDKNRESRVRGLLKDVNATSAKGEPIEIDVKLLKNRNGRRTPIDPLHYIPMFNCFSTEAVERTTGYIETSASELRANARKRR